MSLRAFRLAAAPAAILILIGGGVSEPGFAGVLAAAGVSPAVYSFDPTSDDASDPTPNYSGLGVNATVGYSIAQVLDIAAGARYMPGQRDGFGVGAEDVNVQWFGGELGLRTEKSLYAALRAGSTSYNLVSQAATGDLAGSWSGSGGGISVGVLFPIDRQTAWQATFDVLHAIMEADDVPETGGTSVGKRRVTGVGLSLTFVFNAWQNTAIENTMFKSFLGG